MSEYRREMEQESFSPEEFVERLAWRTVSSGEFDPEKLHSSFTEAINDLKTISEIQRLKCTQVENSFAAEEQHLRSRLTMLMNRNENASENLLNLEKKVNSVATKVVHLGDQLESVNLPRERAKEAASLMRHLTDFLQHGSLLLTDIFRDKEKLFEAAEIIQKLQTISQDLTSTGLPGNTKFDSAVAKIAEKYDEIERSLIEEFAHAQWTNDQKRMKQIAMILSNFKGYSQCINSYIEQSQMGAFKSKDIFDDVLPLCKLNRPIIEYVFPNPEQVMAKFMLHIFHGKVQETVASQLYDRSDKMFQKNFLKNLSTLYSKTRRVVQELKDFDVGVDSTFLEQITEQIFRKHMDNYISLELQCLQTENARILQMYYDSLGHQKRAIQSSFQDIRRDIQAVIGTRANINIAQIENFGGETFLSEEVAINLLQESRLAYSRCSLLSKKSEIAKNGSQILDILTYGLLKEHVDYALELGLQGIPIPEAKSQPVIYFFDVVKRCNAIVHLYEKEFMESLLPLVSATPVLTECMEKKKAYLEQIEMKLDAGIDRALETIVGWVKVILQTEYSQREFFRADSFSDMEKRNLISTACIKVIRFMNSQVERMRDSMDGKNIETVLVELGTRFHRVIYEHLLRFEYSSVGALNVTCDVGEYRKCIREFRSPLLNRLFDTLHALCNLLLVLPNELNLYFNREELTCLDPSVRMNFIQLRTDYKTARQQLNQNLMIRA